MRVSMASPPHRSECAGNRPRCHQLSGRPRIPERRHIQGRYSAGPCGCARIPSHGPGAPLAGHAEPCSVRARHGRSGPLRISPLRLPNRRRRPGGGLHPTAKDRDPHRGKSVSVRYSHAPEAPRGQRSHPDAWASLNSDTSRPFLRPASGRIAVKVINHMGGEVMKVFAVPRELVPS